MTRTPVSVDTRAALFGPFVMNSSRWPLVPLRRLARLRYGDSLVEVRQQDGGLFPIYGSNGMIGSCDRYNARGPCLIIGRKGSAGHLTYVDVPAYSSDTTLFVDSSSTSTHLRWLFYALQPLRLETRSEDSAVPGLSRELAEGMLIPRPPADEQRHIARFLDQETSRIDALIERNQQLIDQLDGWVSAALHDALAGDAPVLPLRRCVRRFIDYRGATPAKASRGIPLITAANVRNGRLNLEAERQFVPHDVYAEWMKRGLPQVGDVIITTEAPLGEIAQIDRLPVALAQRVILLRPNERVMPDYLRAYLLSIRAQNDLVRRATGSTALGIKASHLKALPIVVPSVDDQVRVAGRLREAMELQGRVESTVRAALTTLIEYRRAVIASAITGDIDVRRGAA